MQDYTPEHKRARSEGLSGCEAWKVEVRRGIERCREHEDEDDTSEGRSEREGGIRKGR